MWGYPDEDEDSEDYCETTESSSRIKPEDQVIPRWRDDYEPPLAILEKYVLIKSKATYKILEIVESFMFEFISSETVIALEVALIPYLGDRELSVSLVNNEISISYIDDNGRRDEIRLN